MEILISMKAENINRTYFMNSYQMDMPSHQTNGFFIAEIREPDPEKVELLQKYSDILLKKLNKNGNYATEFTSIGFKLKMKVDEQKDYMEEWEKWVEFSNELHEELEAFFEREDL